MFITDTSLLGSTLYGGAQQWAQDLAVSHWKYKVGTKILFAAAPGTKINQHLASKKAYVNIRLKFVLEPVLSDINNRTGSVPTETVNTRQRDEDRKNNQRSLCSTGTGTLNLKPPQEYELMIFHI